MPDRAKGSTICAACGMPGHRYGRNEGVDRFDPQACINVVLAEVERLRAGFEQAMTQLAEHAAGWERDDLERGIRRLQKLLSDRDVTSCEDLCLEVCAGPCDGRPIGPEDRQ